MTVIVEADFDYIIVGAGSSGCVVANRLSENLANRVLVLEAGGTDKDMWIHVPAGYFRNIYNRKFDWGYETEPVPQFNGRRVRWPRGKVLGGSSSINGLIYVRGQKEDFDLWAQMGNAGWSYEDVLPYFRKAEDNEHDVNEFHGQGGLLAVSDLRAPHELHDAFMAAAQEAGYRFNPDFNGASQEGTGIYQVTVRGMRRCSAATAYLRPAMRRPNLCVRTHAHALRILFEGTRAMGIEYLQDGVIRRVRMRGELILSGGTINSPQLLQLSGIGPGDLLRKHGIRVQRHLPGVGENMQDHIAGRLVYRCINRNTLNDISHNRWLQVYTAMQYLFCRRGPLMTGAAPIGLFVRTRPELKSPDVQFQFLAGSADKPGGNMHAFPGCTVAAIPCRPESRGWLRICSPDPMYPPAIQPNYLQTDNDRNVMIAGLRIARRVMNAPAMQRYVTEEFMPGLAQEADEQILSYVRRTSGTSFHPTGTCMMGMSHLSVVDPELRVHGIENLRVIDASIMPTIVSGNTNAAAIMIGEKGADLVLSAHMRRSVQKDEIPSL